MNAPGKFNLQAATDGDMPALAALHTAVADHLTAVHGPGPWSPRSTERGLRYAMRHSRVLVARLGAEVVGTFRLTTKKPWAIDPKYFSAHGRPLYLLAMAVMPAWQRQGVGRRCLQEAVAVAKAWPADVIRLDAYDAKAGGGGFYSRCGWSERGRASYRGVPLIYFELALAGDFSGAGSG